MPETTACPHCQRMLRLPEALMGKPVKCPGCGHTFPARADQEAALALELATQPVPAANEAPSPGVDQRLGPRRDLLPHNGSMILVLGIVSTVMGALTVITCGLTAIVGVILGPIAWYLGTRDLRDVREGRMDPSGEGQTRAGWICGIIGSCLSGLAVLGCGAYFALIIAMATYTASNPPPMPPPVAPGP